jgi:hypothetical protein
VWPVFVHKRDIAENAALNCDRIQHGLKPIPYE